VGQSEASRGNKKYFLPRRNKVKRRAALNTDVRNPYGRRGARIVPMFDRRNCRFVRFWGEAASD